jgi:hypothetical protein
MARSRELSAVASVCSVSKHAVKLSQSIMASLRYRTSRRTSKETVLGATGSVHRVHAVL